MCDDQSRLGCLEWYRHPPTGTQNEGRKEACVRTGHTNVVGVFSLSSFRILIILGLRGGESAVAVGRRKKLYLVLVVVFGYFCV